MKSVKNQQRIAKLQAKHELFIAKYGFKNNKTIAVRLQMLNAISQ